MPYNGYILVSGIILITTLFLFTSPLYYLTCLLHLYPPAIFTVLTTHSTLLCCTHSPFYTLQTFTSYLLFPLCELLPPILSFIYTSHYSFLLTSLFSRHGTLLSFIMLHMSPNRSLLPYSYCSFYPIALLLLHDTPLPYAI